jgi:glycosyltransferase involved in cell wall biosynthesis
MTAPLHIALLTGGSDKPYAMGLAAALGARDVTIDFVGSDELDCAEIRELNGLRFLNLRGDQSEGVSVIRKALRVLRYYAQLMRYSARRQPRVLHILWNNRFQLFDRTLLMVYYRLLGKRVVLTAHNVNIAKRDGGDSWINRLSLRAQYGLCHHIFVHTGQMRAELLRDFGVSQELVTVIPFGINDTIPRSDLTPAAAKRRLGLKPTDKTLLCFGQIAPYKGLEHVVRAVGFLAKADPSVRLVIAGKIKHGADDYWRHVTATVEQLGLGGQVQCRIGFVPDTEVELYFKAADAVVLPYVDIYQSGVLFLALSFGTPVIATDVGALRDDVIDGVTGFMCPSAEPEDLAVGITTFFSSDLHRSIESRRSEIRRFAADRHSWGTVAELSRAVYERLANGSFQVHRSAHASRSAKDPTASTPPRS